MSDTATKPKPALPCVVQVGFAGSRRLFDDPPTDPKAKLQWQEAVMQHLGKSLDELSGKLGLSADHFLCGISQIACGADMIFTRVCLAREIPQRIFLPQPVEDYLSATDSNGTPDFTAEERSEAEELLASKTIIQQRVVSQSPDRSDRFRETNAEILRVSDVVVCLLRDDAGGKAGGTQEFLRRAKAAGTPALEIRVAVQKGQPVCRNEWHCDPARPFQKPTLPAALDQVSLPECDEKIPGSGQYCAELKKVTGSQAQLHQRLFRYAVALIIATHILATVFATGALALHGHERPQSVEAPSHPQAPEPVPTQTAGGDAVPEASSSQPLQESHGASFGEKVIPWLLGIELALLLAGFSVHQYLHRSKAARLWANARVLAEVARSVLAINPRHLYLEHLLRLSLPHSFRYLLRTINVLYLRSTYGSRNDAWETRRDKYNNDRIKHQINYYTEKLAKDKFKQRLCQVMFISCSVLAMAATAVKLALLIRAAMRGSTVAIWPQVFGTLAIVLPVLAVAGLSWSAALDYEARVESFGETLDFLKRQEKILPQVDTAAEFDRRMLETETLLLGEVANWFSRRANTGVT